MRGSLRARGWGRSASVGGPGEMSSVCRPCRCSEPASGIPAQREAGQRPGQIKLRGRWPDCLSELGKSSQGSECLGTRPEGPAPATQQRGLACGPPRPCVAAALLPLLMGLLGEKPGV